MNTKRSEIFLSKKNLLANLKALQEALPGHKMFPVIKANAYGHGLNEIAGILESEFNENTLPFFCVARSSEAFSLRAAGLKHPVLVLSAFSKEDLLNPPERTSFVIKNKEELEVISSMSSDSLKKIEGIHLKFNTGMNRVGMSSAFISEAECSEELFSILKKIEEKKENLVQGLMTHFADSETIDSELTQKQIESFERILKSLKEKWSQNLKSLWPSWIHMSNSAAIAQGKKIDAFTNAARPGLHLWGVRSEKSLPEQIKIKPVLSFKVPISHVFELNAGDAIGYGHRFRAQRKSLIGVLPVGYADGVRRSVRLPEKTPLNVYIKGEPCPIVGVVSMDMLAVDLTDHSEKEFLGVRATLIGEEQSAEDWAEHCETISYEILTSLAPRLRRVIIE